MMKTAWIAGVLGLLMTTAQFAAGAEIEVKPEPLWIDAYGETKAFDWPMQAELVIGGPEPPFVRFSVQVPKGLSVQSIDDSSIPIVRNARDAEFSEPDLEVIRFDISGLTQSINLKIKHEDTGETEERSLSFNYKIPEVLYVDESCRSAGISAEAVASGKGPHFPFVVLRCEASRSTALLSIFWSEDAKWDQCNLGKEKQAGKTWKIQEVDLPPSSAGAELGEFSISEARSSTKYRFRVQHSALAERKRNYWISLAASLLNYEEVRRSQTIAVSETAITAKAGWTYRREQSTTEFAASGFVTLMPLSNTPAQLDPMRFFGLNVRYGWDLPSGFLEWPPATVSLGWYFLKMAVPSKQYGVNLLLGPQIFISTDLSRAGGRKATAYFKFAPISGRFGAFDLGDREFAIGGSYALMKVAGKLPLSVSLDLSHAQYSSDTVANKMSLLSVSLGVSVAL